MPITPIHLGPALAAKAIAPRHFSFLIFGITQVAIDSEAAFHLLRGDWPIHRLFHTYLGATLVAVLTVAAGRPLLAWAIGLWNRLLAHPAGERLSDRASDTAGRGAVGSFDRRIQPRPPGQHPLLGRKAVRPVVR